MNQVTILDDLITTREVAALFGKTYLCILNWRRDEGLPHYRIPGDVRDTIRYDRKAVLKWAQENGKAFARQKL